MNPTRKLAARIGAGVAGTLLGTLVVLALGGLDASDPRADKDTAEAPSRLPSAASPSPPKLDAMTGGGGRAGTGRERRPDAFLAWTPGSLPPRAEARLESMRAVRRATTVYAGLDWIESSRDASGVVDRPPPGYAVPFEIAAVEPSEYARFVPPGDRAAVRGLEQGEALLAETERDLRGAGAGLRMDLGERTLRATDVVSDIATNGYEALIAGPPPPEWVRADRFVLAHLRHQRDRTTVERALQALMPRGDPLQTRAEGENPFLRYGDAVLPQLLVKETFGEFAARPLPDGTIDIHDPWEQRNIRFTSVPILGRVKCHRVLFPQLREALRDVQREGLAHAIQSEQYGGCSSPRFINLDPNGRLSHHSWGIAIDLNVAENRYGTRGNLDMRVVEIFEDRWGFTWGGRWIHPDPMHFEWIKFP